MNPATALYEQDELAEDVANTDVLVLSHRWDNWSEPNESVDYGPDTANQIVRDQFCLTGDQDTASVFEVYRSAADREEQRPRGERSELVGAERPAGRRRRRLSTRGATRLT